MNSVSKNKLNTNNTPLHMKTRFFVIFLLHVCYFANAQPNIVFIIGDDISVDDIGCYGNSFVSTPNIDKLAKQGIKFNNAYLTISSCSPSRGSILTGRYPHNHGGPELHAPYADNQVLFPKLLKDAGYYTAQAGKWHLGALSFTGIGVAAFDTKEAGSSEGIGGPSGASLWIPRLRERPKDKPFFMWFAAHDAHLKWDDSKIVTKKYTPEEVKVPKLMVDDLETRKNLASFYNEITRLDFNIGEVIKELEAQGVLDNTIIVVMADNGRPFFGYKCHLRTGGIKTPLVISWPKHIKKKGAVSNSLVSSIDIAPTLLEACGVKPVKATQGKSFLKLLNQPENHFRNYVFAEHNWHAYQAYERMVCDGRYLYIENGLPNVPNIGTTDILGAPGVTADDGVVRGAGYTLVSLFKAGKLDSLRSAVFVSNQSPKMLYDLSKDPECLENIYSYKQNKEIGEKLSKKLLLWKKQTGDYQPETGKMSLDIIDRKTFGRLPTGEKRGEMPGDRTNAKNINHSGPF